MAISSPLRVAAGFGVFLGIHVLEGGGPSIVEVAPCVPVCRSLRFSMDQLCATEVVLVEDRSAYSSSLEVTLVPVLEGAV